VRQDRVATLRHAERRLETVLAEGLACSRPLRAWFAAACAAEFGRELEIAPGGIELTPERRSAHHGWALRVVAASGGEIVVLLVAHLARHDPHAASAARAAARAEVESGAARALTLWIAPAGAAVEGGRGSVGWDGVLRREAVLSALMRRAEEAEGELAARLRHQLDALASAEAAIEETLAQIDGAACPFRRDYLAFLAEAAPSLPVEDALDAAEPGCGELAFDADALPRWPFMPRTRLIHHVRAGAATVLIDGWGAQAERVAHAIEPSLAGTDFALAFARGGPGDAVTGLFIVLDVPPLDPLLPFEAQRDKAERCAAGLRDIQRWFVRRRPVARYWAEAAGETVEAESGRLRRGGVDL
jgi:hypothetical protein